jgi:F-type H+-transporting ATPase subunit b
MMTFTTSLAKSGCQLSLLALLSFLPAASLAAGSGGPSDGIPVDVLYQAINFALFVGLGFFFLRKPVSSYFSSREQAFKQALVRAQAAREEAEQRKTEIQMRLSKLQATADDSIEKARAEAAELRSRIVLDAADLAKKLREDAEATANAEIERAKRELREDVLAQAVALSRKVLDEKMAEQDQKRLQTEFVDKIQVVRQ